MSNTQTDSYRPGDRRRPHRAIKATASRGVCRLRRPSSKEAGHPCAVSRPVLGESARPGPIALWKHAAVLVDSAEGWLTEIRVLRLGSRGRPFTHGFRGTKHHADLVDQGGLLPSALPRRSEFAVHIVFRSRG